jgi:hypothetical protein
MLISRKTDIWCTLFTFKGIEAASVSPGPVLGRVRLWYIMRKDARRFKKDTCDCDRVLNFYSLPYRSSYMRLASCTCKASKAIPCVTAAAPRPSSLQPDMGRELTAACTSSELHILHSFLSLGILGHRCMSLLLPSLVGEFLSLVRTDGLIRWKPSTSVWVIRGDHRESGVYSFLRHASSVRFLFVYSSTACGTAKRGIWSVSNLAYKSPKKQLERSVLFTLFLPSMITQSLGHNHKMDSTKRLKS